MINTVCHSVSHLDQLNTERYKLKEEITGN